MISEAVEKATETTLKDLQTVWCGVVKVKGWAGGVK
jgi:hypothetical protein